MTVKELIAELKTVEGDRLVVVAQDSEGNGFSPLHEVARAAYVADCKWSGEIFLEELTDADRAAGYEEDDVRPKAPKAVVLWPVN